MSRRCRWGADGGCQGRVASRGCHPTPSSLRTDVPRAGSLAVVAVTAGRWGTDGDSCTGPSRAVRHLLVRGSTSGATIASSAVTSPHVRLTPQRLTVYRRTCRRRAETDPLASSGGSSNALLTARPRFAAEPHGSSCPGPAGPSRVASADAAPWDRTNQKFHVRLQLIDSDGEPVELEGPDGQPAPIGAEAEMEAGRPPGVPHGSDIGSASALSLGPMPLTPGRYDRRLSINGDEVTAEPFTVLGQIPRRCSAAAAPEVCRAPGLSSVGASSPRPPRSACAAADARRQGAARRAVAGGDAQRRSREG